MRYRRRRRFGRKRRSRRRIGHKRIVNHGQHHINLRPPSRLLADKATVRVRAIHHLKSKDDIFYTKQVVKSQTDYGGLFIDHNAATIQAIGYPNIAPNNTEMFGTVGILTDLDKSRPGLFMVGPGTGQAFNYLGAGYGATDSPFVYNGLEWYSNSKWYTKHRMMWTKISMNIQFNSVNKADNENDRVLFFARGTDHDPGDTDYWFENNVTKYPYSQFNVNRGMGSIPIGNSHFGEFAVLSADKLAQGVMGAPCFVKKTSTLKRGFRVKFYVPTGKLQRHLTNDQKTYLYSNTGGTNFATTTHGAIFVLFGIVPLESQKVGTEGYNYSITTRLSSKVRLYHPPVPEIERVKAVTGESTSFHPMSAPVAAPPPPP